MNFVDRLLIALNKPDLPIRLPVMESLTLGNKITLKA